MNKNKLTVIAACLFAATSMASAANVSYTTSGSFGGALSVSSGDNSMTFDALTAPQSVSTNTLNPTNISFGAINVNSGGSAAGGFSSPFSLSLTQLSPLPNQSLTQTFGVASLAGMLVANGSNVFLTFPEGGNVLTFASGGILSTYTIDRVTRIVPSTSNFGVATLQGTLQTTAVVPLPASVWAGLGLFTAIGAVKLRRKSRV